MVLDSGSRCLSSVEGGETSMLKTVKLEEVGKFLLSRRESYVESTGQKVDKVHASRL
jgi:hypothetical protein